ncbi:hypothetical protein ACFL1Q_01115 [Patescibacteria group bacterium]
MVKNTANKKGFVHLGLIVVVILIGVVILVGGNFLFGPGDLPGSFLANTVGPPPEDPEARKAWISENVDNNDHETFVKLDYKVPSWKKLDKMNESLTRKYPTYIKATQTYGTLPNLIEVLYFSDVLADLGVNTQFIHANYWLREGELKLWYLGYDKPRDYSQDKSKRALVHNILLAKQQGLSVVLFPDYVQFEDGGMEEHNITPEDLSRRLEAVSLELAPIAEKYNVDYFVPVNQIEAIMDSNNYPVEKTREVMNAFYARVVPQIRKLYSGKVMYKMGGFSNWSNYEGVSLVNADIFGVTACGRAPSPEQVTRDVQLSSVQARKMSKEYGIPWIGAEFMVNNASDQMQMFGEVKTDYSIEELYKVGLTAFDKYGNSAVGFTVHSLLGAGKIYDTAAYPLVKEFFASK